MVLNGEHGKCEVIQEESEKYRNPATANAENLYCAVSGLN